MCSVLSGMEWIGDVASCVEWCIFGVWCHYNCCGLVFNDALHHRQNTPHNTTSPIHSTPDNTTHRPPHQHCIVRSMVHGVVCGLVICGCVVCLVWWVCSVVGGGVEWWVVGG